MYSYLQKSYSVLTTTLCRWHSTLCYYYPHFSRQGQRLRNLLNITLRLVMEPVPYQTVTKDQAPQVTILY